VLGIVVSFVNCICFVLESFFLANGFVNHVLKLSFIIFIVLFMALKGQYGFVV